MAGGVQIQNQVGHRIIRCEWDIMIKFPLTSLSGDASCPANWFNNLFVGGHHIVSTRWHGTSLLLVSGPQ